LPFSSSVGKVSMGVVSTEAKVVKVVKESIASGSENKGEFGL
jgi:hypothetical protein